MPSSPLTNSSSSNNISDTQEKEKTVTKENTSNATTIALESSFSDGASSSPLSFVVERDELHRLISQLINTNLSDDDDNRRKTRDEALSKIRNILDNYLEQPTLLDPYLVELVQHTLIAKGRDIMHQLFFQSRLSNGSSIDETNTINGDNDAQINVTKDGDGMDKNIKHSQEKVTKKAQLSYILSAIYAFCKVCTHKKVQRLLSHEANDVESVFYMLQQQQAYQKKSKHASFEEDHDCEAQSWESSYVLLLWMEMLSYVPFDLQTIDSTSTFSSFTTSTSISLVESIISTCKSHLCDAGPTRRASASCLAAYLSRPDLEKELYLTKYVEWSNNSVLQKELNATTINSSNTNVFRVMGVVQSLAVIFKSDSQSTSRSSLLLQIDVLWEPMVQLALWNNTHNEANGSSNNGGSNSGGMILLRKLLIKFFGRIGCAYLPPVIAKWRYQRGKRSLLANLNPDAVQDQHHTSQTTSKESEKSCFQEHKQDGKEKAKDKDEEPIAQIEIPILEKLEDVLDILLNGLRDTATIVRWSSAKHIGRLTERLPSVLCVDDVVESILNLCGSGDLGGETNENAWHGSCLALAELARRGLLLPQRMEEVVPIVVKAMQYDVRRGSHSVGSNVRDAACYTCWAFARAFEPSVLKPYVPDLSLSMVVTCLFDREINCRRAASAAFQECVGRQGSENFKHGIDILTKADYFSLGNRTDAYTKVACSIAIYNRYRIPLLQHLSYIKLFHWDIELRTLSSKAIHELIVCDISKKDKTNTDDRGRDYASNVLLPSLISKCMSHDLFVRHGAVLGVAEIVLALSKNLTTSNRETIFSTPDYLTTVTELGPEIEKARLYRGRGGEMMRSGVCRLIECISLARLSLSVKQQVRLLDSIDDSIKHPSSDVQNTAVSALRALMNSYFPVNKETNIPSSRLQNRVVIKYITIVKTDDNPAATRGFSLALGCLPAKLLAWSMGVLEDVLQCLCDTSKPVAKVGGECDAETKRNAILALTTICQTVGIGDNRKVTPITETAETGRTVGLDKMQVSKIFDTFLECLEDYSTDRRGDVGSWCRTAAITGLEQLTYLAVEASTDVPSLFITAEDSMMKEGAVAGKGDTGIAKTDHDTVDEMQEQKAFLNIPTMPSYTDRCLLFESDAISKVANSMKDIERAPIRKELIGKTNIDDESSSLLVSQHCCCYFDDLTCARVIGSLLKQLSEKLDSVRCHAGLSLERLLSSKRPKIPFVSHKSLLIEALRLDSISPPTTTTSPKGEKVNKNYSNPAYTFPLVMRAVNIDAFFEYIISGMIISVGGLTESVVKSSTFSLLEWLKGLKKVKGFGRIAKFGKCLLRLLDQYERNDRVVLPLVKCIGKILSHGLLNDLLHSKEYDDNEGKASNNRSDFFASELICKLELEAKRSSNVSKLLSIVDVAVKLLGFENKQSYQNGDFLLVMKLLGHQYPRVRRFAAEQLYVKMIEDEGLSSSSSSNICMEISKGEYHQVSSLLLEVAWDDDLDGPHGNVREARNKVADLLHVKLTDSIRLSRKPNQEKMKKSLEYDELDSYQSLVDNA